MEYVNRKGRLESERKRERERERERESALFLLGMDAGASSKQAQASVLAKKERSTRERSVELSKLLSAARDYANARLLRV